MKTAKRRYSDRWVEYGLQVDIPARLPLRRQGAGIQVFLLLIDTCFCRYEGPAYGHRSRTLLNDYFISDFAVDEHGGPCL